MFDAIYDDAHYSLGHLKSSVTWREVNHHVYNITIQHVNAFISVCPVCIHVHPQIPKSKGAQCPIHSGEFCDCMQIDLIDYCANEQRNVYGQVMQWIMVVKDHFTGLCY